MQNQSFRVRAHKIESYRDSDGNRGKRIELVEDLEDQSSKLGLTDEAKMFRNVTQQLQITFIPSCPKQMFCIPKIILFLTEYQCETLAVAFEVNRIYECRLENCAIKFSEVKDST